MQLFEFLRRIKDMIWLSHRDLFKPNGNFTFRYFQLTCLSVIQITCCGLTKRLVYASNQIEQCLYFPLITVVSISVPDKEMLRETMGTEKGMTSIKNTVCSTVFTYVQWVFGASKLKPAAAENKTDESRFCDLKIGKELQEAKILHEVRGPADYLEFSVGLTL